MVNAILIVVIITLSLLLGYSIAEVVYIFRGKKKRKNESLQLQEPPPEGQEKQPVSLLEKKMMLEGAIATIEKLSEAISFSLNLTELSREIVKTTSNILNVEICVLMMLDETSNTLKVVASSGIDTAFAETIRIKIGDEISGLTAQYNNIKIINSLERDAKLYSLKYDKCYKTNLASFPISYKNKILGILNLSNKRNNQDFLEGDVIIVKIIAMEAAIALQNAKLIKEQQKNYLNTIITLAKAIDARDPYTYFHSNNVTKYAVKIAEELQMHSYEIENIRYAGLLHDIGKIGIKDAILSKPGKLTDEEYEEIKKHPAKGAEIVASLPFLQNIVAITKHHHERFDGTGYPDKLKGNNIELGARILNVADSFDAMTTKRSYHNPLSLEEAKKELINGKNKQFDPKIVDCFIQILEREPQIINEEK